MPSSRCGKNIKPLCYFTHSGGGEGSGVLGILAIKIALPETQPHLLLKGPWVSLVNKPKLDCSGYGCWIEEAKPLDFDGSLARQSPSRANDRDSADTELQTLQLFPLGKHPVNELPGELEVVAKDQC